MKRVLSIFYLIFFVVITVQSTLDHLQIKGYPFWMTVSELTLPALGAVSMLLHTFSYKPKPYAWAWKIVPFMLVSYYMLDWYFDLVVFKQPDDTPRFFWMATVLGFLLLVPLLYSSFKFGYSKDYEW